MRPVAALFAGAFLAAGLLDGCGQPAPASSASSTTSWHETEPTGRMEPDYATQFTVDEYADGSRLVTIGGTDRYLVVPEEKTAPADLPADVTVLQRPLDQIYLVVGKEYSSVKEELERVINQLKKIRMDIV